MSPALSVELRRVLQQAEEVLDACEHGEVPLPHRRRVWDALGEGTEGHGSPGHRRRAELDLITVEHVKDVWDSTYPSDPAVEQVLDAARQVLEGKRAARWSDDFQGRAQVKFLNRMNADYRFRAGYVGHAACCALSTAAHDKSYADLPPHTDDYDVDSEDWDASFLAAMAAAGGEVGDPDASDGRRREFWKWYLREAVPAAWNAEG